MVHTLGMDTMTTALRKLIQHDGRSLNQIGHATGIDSGRLSRFMRADRTITLEAADQLVSGLGYTVKLVKAKGK